MAIKSGIRQKGVCMAVHDTLRFESGIFKINPYFDDRLLNLLVT